MSNRHVEAHLGDSSHARLTCEPCRERKVKCNRTFPSCNRCTRLGSTCAYRSRITHRASQSAIIPQLEKLIRETEALLALQLTGTNLDLSNENFMPLPSTSPSFTTPTSPDPTISLSPTATGQLLTDDDHVPVTGDYNLAWLANTNFDDIQSLVPTTVDMEMAVAMNLEPIHSDHPRRQNWPRSSKDWFTTGTPESTQSFTPAHSISAKDLQDLQYIFFNHIHPVMPIINPTCFYQALQNAPDIVAVMSVSYAIALLATTVPETLPSLQKPCYALTKHYVNKREEGFQSFMVHELPSGTSTDLDADFKQASLPIIDQVQSITRPELLTPFSGLVLTVFALRKVFEHTLPDWGTIKSVATDLVDSFAKT